MVDRFFLDMVYTSILVLVMHAYITKKHVLALQRVLLNMFLVYVPMVYGEFHSYRASVCLNIVQNIPVTSVLALSAQTRSRDHNFLRFYEMNGR
jgi:hypothetical protein